MILILKEMNIHNNIVVICDSNLELDGEKSIYNQDLEINGQRMSDESNLDWKKIIHLCSRIRIWGANPRPD
jgi:hypothetical protein